MKLGCCTWNFMTKFPSLPDDAITKVGELGFEGFELIAFSKEELRENYSIDRISHLVKLYESLGLILSEFVIDSGALRGLARFDKEQKDDALETFDLATSVARDLGTKLINFVPNWPYGLSAPHQYLPLYIHPVIHGAQSTAGPTWRFDLPQRFDWQEIWENYLDSLVSCSTIAASKGVCIALEGHPQTILSNSDSFLRLFDRFDLPELGVNFDTADSAAVFREYPALTIHKLGKKIFHVHARDTDGSLNYSLPAGSGILDWPMIVESLRQIAFDGFISIELGENCREPEIHLTKARDYLRDVIKEKDYSN